MTQDTNVSSTLRGRRDRVPRWVFGLALMTMFGAAYVAGRGSLASLKRGSAAARGGAVLYYVDPMHPSYRSDRPGKAPDCGMDLEPVYAGAETVKAAPAGGPHVVALTPEQERAGQLRT